MPAVEEQETAGLSAIERKHLRRIQELEAECELLEGAYEVAKASASVAKKKWEEAVASLRTTIRSGPDAQQELEFASEGCGETPIEHALTLSGKQLETLRDAGVSTVEDFEALRAGKIQGFKGGLRDLPRVGQATADKWEDEILDWIGRQEQSELLSADEDQGDDEEVGDE